MQYALDRAAAANLTARIVADGYDTLDGRYRTWAAQIADTARGPWVERLAAALPPGARILDLGCGSGVPTARALAERFRVIGIDVSARQVEFARVAVPAGTFVVGDMTAVRFDSASFEAVIALYSLIHVPGAELPQLLRRIGNWLVPEGLMLATFGTTEGEGVQSDWLGVPMFFAGHDSSTNRALVFDAGFTILCEHVVTTLERREGEVAFHWLLARRTS